MAIASRTDRGRVRSRNEDALGFDAARGWAVLAAGNRETDRAVTARMPSALANRFVHIEVEADLDDWRRWASTPAANWPRPIPITCVPLWAVMPTA